MKKNNILIITELFPNKRFPQLGTFVVNQVDYLKQYYNITIITPVYFGFKLFYKKEIKENGISIIRVRQPILILSIIRRLFKVPKHVIFSWNKYFISKKIYKTAKKLNNNKDFKLIIGHESGAGDEACLVAEKLNKPSIFHLHGIYEYHLKSFGKTGMKKILKNINKASYIISVSGVAINSYIKNNLIVSNTSTIPNILNKNICSYQNVEWEHVMKNKKVILGVGWLVKEKGFNNLITIAKKLKNYKDVLIIIIGNGPEYKNYQNLISELDLKNIHIIKKVEPKNIGFFYKNSYVLVHPSEVDSFSMVCLEAMSYGKPIICTDRIGIAEYIKNEQEGFIIELNDNNQLFKKILTLIENQTLKKEMGRKAYITSQNFKYDIIGKQINNIYKKYTNA